MKLRDFNESLNHIAWIQIPNSLNELVKSIIVLLLLIKIVGMLFTNLSYDFLREISIRSYFLGFRVQPFLKKSLDFDIVFHFMKFEKSFLVFLIRSQHIDSILFNFKAKNSRIWLTEKSHLVGEVIYWKLSSCLYLLYFYNMIFKESKEIFFAF